MAVGTRRRVAHGGVSPKVRQAALHGAQPGAAVVGGISPAAATFPGFVYNGGPVVRCPQIYTSFWGSLWRTDPSHMERAGRLNQFLRDLAQSSFMNVLTQYGVNTMGFLMRACVVDSIPSTLTSSDVESIVQCCIDAGALPEPSNPADQVVVIYLDENTGVDDPDLGIVMCEPTCDSAFGYHLFFTTAAGNPCYYAVIPSLSDRCLIETCPSDSSCSLHLSATQEQRLTQVTSHEFAEMVTDPEVSAWYDPEHGECGDICNGEVDVIPIGNETWTVQRIYSRYDDIRSDGAVHCLSSASTPEPVLSPGPVALTAGAISRAMRAGPVDRLLPLPAIHFDALSKRVTQDPTEVRRYVGRIFSPLRHTQVISDLPGFLRNVAGILEKA